MELETFQFTKKQGWSVKNFPDLDSENTLILIFADPEFINDPSPIDELVDHYKKSNIIGCSSLSGVFGTFVLDESVSLVSISDHNLIVSVIRFQHTEIKTMTSEIVSENNCYEIGKKIINTLSDDKTKEIFIFSQCQNKNFNELISGVNSQNSSVKCYISGALPSTRENKDLGWVIANGEIKKNSVVAFGLSGDALHVEYHLKEESNLFCDKQIPVLALCQLNENNSSGSDEAKIEEALTFLPTQTKLVGFSSACKLINAGVYFENAKQPIIILHEDLDKNIQEAYFSNILNGREIAKKILHKIKNELIDIKKMKKRSPKLSLLYLNEHGHSNLYATKIKKACDEVGINFDCYPFSSNIKAEKLIATIKKLNDDSTVDGIQLCLPLPKHINQDIVVENINPLKDSDSIHPYNLGKIMQGVPDFQSCAAKGIMLLLESIQYELKGKHAVVLGASNAGKPIVLSLLQAGCTVSVCNIYTPDLSNYVKQADVLISAVGHPDLVKGEWIKQGAIVIDMGVTVLPDGVMKGDVEFEVAKQKAAWIAPVSGGLGPVTVAVLLQNTLNLFKKNNAQYHKA